jgi:hypothetical protein
MPLPRREVQQPDELDPRVDPDAPLTVEESERVERMAANEILHGADPAEARWAAEAAVRHSRKFHLRERERSTTRGSRSV